VDLLPSTNPEVFLDAKKLIHPSTFYLLRIADYLTGVTVATERIVAETKIASVPMTPKEFADAYLRSNIHEENERELEDHLASPNRALQTEEFKQAVEMEKAKVRFSEPVRSGSFFRRQN
jgi:hypothetical protein